jgi:hypothetical protein
MGSGKEQFFSRTNGDNSFRTVSPSRSEIFSASTASFGLPTALFVLPEESGARTKLLDLADFGRRIFGFWSIPNDFYAHLNAITNFPSRSTNDVPRALAKLSIPSLLIVPNRNGKGVVSARTFERPSRVARHSRELPEQPLRFINYDIKFVERNYFDQLVKNSRS